MTPFQEVVRKSGIAMCVECGKCGSVCPISIFTTGEFESPRLLAEKALSGSPAEIRGMALFWSCPSCRRCSGLCPASVQFTEFIRDARKIAVSEGHSGPCTHGGTIKSWMGIMTDPALAQNRTGWLAEDLEISDTSDTIFFAGCLPYYHELFHDSGFEGVEIARSAIRILNRMGIRPRVSSQERCCGHDLLWQGDIEKFRSLGALNLEMLKKTGATRIVTACPECALTLSVDYPRHLGSRGIEVLHLSQILAAGIADGTISLENPGAGRRVTFHDPCRLGRHLGVYDPPRVVIDAMGYNRVEMSHFRKNALCCGTSCWTACGSTNREIQLARLGEAAATGAGILVTACLKCQIHLLCALKGSELEPELKVCDLATLASAAIPRQKRPVKPGDR